MLMLLAWGFEIVLGWPEWLYRRIRHPVVWIGALTSIFDRTLNRPAWSHRLRYLSGMIAALTIVMIIAGVALCVSYLLPNTWPGFIVEGLIASSLIASRSLHSHIKAVLRPLAKGDIAAARTAVSMIVGRDPSRLDEAGIARASLESLAENASDGVIAPLFWGAIFGLPGLAIYKAINTLDSMIGHKNDKYAAFGGFSARLDDVANFIPARITGFLIAAASVRLRSLRTMLRDAGSHRSPNAGWPEAAMAGALNVRLSGPRAYGDVVRTEPWLNEDARDPTKDDVGVGLALYRHAMILGAVCLVIVAMGVFL